MNLRAPRESKTYDTTDSFYEELQQVFNMFYKNDMSPMLRDFIAKVETDGKVPLKVLMVMGLEQQSLQHQNI
jgi:hypothetical protein